MKRRKWFGEMEGTFPCPECDGEVEVIFTPGNPGKTYGRPENCYPPDPPELDCPDECPHCGETISGRTQDDWCNRMEERCRDMEDSYYDDRD